MRRRNLILLSHAHVRVYRACFLAPLSLRPRDSERPEEVRQAHVSLVPHVGALATGVRRTSLAN
jgi:hypothetical protein